MLHIKKLGIGTPSNGEMKVETAFSMATALRDLQVPTQMFLTKGPYVHQNRTTIMEMAIEHGCSHLLFIDTDMLFDADAIAKIIAHDLPIVGANYNMRVPIKTPIVQGEMTILTEVPYVPTGFMLINLDLVKDIPKPWFFFDKNATSEDVYFCNKARECDLKVYCDPTIYVGHIGNYIY